MSGKNLSKFFELEKFFDESFPQGLGDISDYGFQSLKNSLDNISSVKPFKSKNCDEIYLDAPNPNLKKGCDRDFLRQPNL